MQKLGREVTTLGNYCYYTKNRLWTSCPCFRGGGVLHTRALFARAPAQ